MKFHARRSAKVRAFANAFFPIALIELAVIYS